MDINGVSGYSQQALHQVNNSQNLQQVNTGRLDSDGDRDGDNGISTDKESSSTLLPPGVGQNINVSV